MKGLIDSIRNFRFFAIYDKGLTPSVRSWFLLFGIALLCQMCVDYWAWSRAWGYMLPKAPWYSWPMIFGLCFAAVIFVFDISVIRADVTKSRSALMSIFGRFVVLVGIAFLTAVPAELAFFESKIDARMDKEEIAALTKLKDEATAKETDATKVEVAKVDAKYLGDGTPANPGLIAETKAKYNGDGTPANPGLIAQKRTAVPAARTRAKGQAQQAYDTYKADRDRQRNQKRGPKAAEVAAQQTKYDNLAAEVAAEASGKGKGASGRYGMGQAYKAKVALMNTAKTELDALKVALGKIDAALVPFDAETQTKLQELSKAIVNAPNTAGTSAQGVVDGLIAERDTKVNALRTAHETKVKALERELKDKTTKIKDTNRETAKWLTDTYGGEWKKPRGIMERFKELQEISNEDPIANMMIWGSRVVMMLIGLIILFLKLNAKGDIRDYYNRDLQMVLARDNALAEVVAAQGFGDPRVLHYKGLDHKSRTLLDKLETARHESSRVTDNWRKSIGTLCEPLPNGRCRTRQQIIAALEAGWFAEGGPKDKVRAVERAKQAVRAGSLDLNQYPWPEELGINPSTLREPWNVAVDELVRYEWKDPQIAQHRVDDATGHLNALRIRYEQIVLDRLEKPLREYIAAVPLIRYDELSTAQMAYRTEIYNKGLSPVLMAIQRCEQVIRENGGQIPTWQTTFVIGQKGIHDIHLMPSPEVLSSNYGWRGSVSQGTLGDLGDLRGLAGELPDLDLDLDLPAAPSTGDLPEPPFNRGLPEAPSADDDTDAAQAADTQPNLPAVEPPATPALPAPPADPNAADPNAADPNAADPNGPTAP